MDYHGVPWRGVCPGPDEGRELRGDAHCYHSTGGAQRSRLPTFGEEAPQGY